MRSTALCRRRIFSVGRGWFDAPFTVVLTSPVAGAIIRYTTNGREPAGTSRGRLSDPICRFTPPPCSGPLRSGNALPSLVVTHTYLFADQVLRDSRTILLAFRSAQRSGPATRPII